MCHVTKYSTILGVFQRPWPGVSPTAILNEEKTLGTRLDFNVKLHNMFICPRGFLLHSQALSGLMLLQISWSAAAQFFAAPVSVLSRSLLLPLITLTETLIIPDIAKTESNNCFIIHCFTGKQKNGKQFQHLCPSCLPASGRFFSLRYSWNSSFASFVSLLLFSKSFCFSNFSISCSVEEANRPAMNLLRFQMPPALLLEIMHCSRNLQIIH